MSTAPATVPSAETTGNHRTLSQPIRLGILAASVVLGAAIVTLLFGWNVLAVVLVSALIYSVAIYSASAVVEGHRHAVDRLVTAIVTTAFLLAMIPLVSVILTIVQHGWHRLDEHEVALGAPHERERIKVVDRDEMVRVSRGE